MKAWEKELIDTLNQFEQKENKIIHDVFHEVAEETKDMVAAKSPGKGEYASGWEVKTKNRGGDVDYIVCNPEHYQLTHLLEKGHVVRNQYGSPKVQGKLHRTRARRHIKPAERKGIQLLLKELKSKL